jgi:hypothetical protein
MARIVHWMRKEGMSHWDYFRAVFGQPDTPAPVAEKTRGSHYYAAVREPDGTILCRMAVFEWRTGGEFVYTLHSEESPQEMGCPCDPGRAVLAALSLPDTTNAAQMDWRRVAKEASDAREAVRRTQKAQRQLPL